MACHDVVETKSPDDLMFNNQLSQSISSDLDVPVFSDEEPTAPKHDFKIHVAIDFGTDGTALAYAIDGIVFAHKEWNSSKFEVSLKPKTIVLLDEDYDVLAFGENAKHMFS